MSQPVHHRLGLATSAGRFVATYSGLGLAALDFPSARAKAAPVAGTKDLPAEVRSWHALATAAVRAVLAGREPDELPPLDVRHGTEFQQQVWECLVRLRLGKTCHYGELAAALGRPGAARAVGSACGANRIPLLIPCHRVLAANGRLGGFSGGLAWKRRLLAAEGIRAAR